MHIYILCNGLPIAPVGQNVNKAKTNVINHKIVADALSDD